METGTILKKGEFWLMNAEGDLAIRNLEEEAKEFTHERYYRGEFDAFNYVWFENFDNYEHEANGCDYERLGCKIREGDVVLDIGANVGVFSRRAELQGASRVIAVEPLTPTYECLKRNIGLRTEAYKMGLSGETHFPEFQLHTNYTHLGGGTKIGDINQGRNIIHRERALCLNVNHFFESGLFDRADFMKIDIEGGEFDLLRGIKDEHLAGLRCLSMELHDVFPDTEEFQQWLIQRMYRLGFTSFVLYYSTSLRTVSFWKF